MNPDKPIYLDYNATTPLAPEVIVAMRPFLEEHFGNPSSAHAYGCIAHEAVEVARAEMAALIHVLPEEIIFTSGGTEANNLALLGLAQSYPMRKHIITSAIEHPAVTTVCDTLSKRGFEVTTLPVDTEGRVSPSDLEAALRPQTLFVSIMHANNEVGTIQPIQELARLTHAAGAFFHTDAAQSIGKIPVNVTDMGVDLLSIAGHKLYAPKGVGALFVRKGIALERIIFGAGQERGLRPGTENVLEIVGLGKAAEIASRDLDQNQVHFVTLRDRLHQGLIVVLPDGSLRLNGSPDDRLPNTLNLSFKQMEANRLLEEIQDSVAASAGAACHAGQVEISSVLMAMRVPIEWAKGAVRFSVGRMTTVAEIDIAIQKIASAYYTHFP